MKRRPSKGKLILILGILFFSSISTITLASDLTQRLGIGLGWPCVSLKYGLSSKYSIEGIAAFGDGIASYGGRVYYNFNPSDRTVILAGAEGNYISFDEEDISGNGYMGYFFVGGEHFISDNFTFSLDIGPAYIGLAEDEFDLSIGGIEWVSNLGIKFYLSSSKKKKSEEPKEKDTDEDEVDFITNLGLTHYKSSYKLYPPERIKKQEKPPAQIIPKPEPKIEPETTSPSPPKTTFEEANLIVKMDTSLYSGPSAVYSVITKLDRDTKLLLLDEANPAYYKVELSDGTVGWVASFHVKTTEASRIKALKK